MAVLISSESASAPRSWPAALKRTSNRAVIVGRQSFRQGLGAGPLRFQGPGNRHESALKLTIAQYLTPGDVSIQEVGIVPDIELVPARILRPHRSVRAPKTFREADLRQALLHGFARDEEQAKAGRERVQQKPIESCAS